MTSTNAALVPHDLVTCLGRTVGLEELLLDANGLCVLELGEQPAVHVQAEPETGAFLLYAAMAPLPVDVGAAYLLGLLEANLFWHATRGATLAVEDDGGSGNPRRAVLSRRIPWRGMDPQEFVAAFGEFFNAMEGLREWLLGEDAPAGIPERRGALMPGFA